MSILDEKNRSMDIVNIYNSFGVFLDHPDHTQYIFPSRRLQLAVEVGNDPGNLRRKIINRAGNNLIASNYQFAINEIHFLDMNSFDLTDIVETLNVLSEIGHQIINAEEKNLTGFLLIKIKGIPTKVPVKLACHRHAQDEKAKIVFGLYKEPSSNNRKISLELNEIESIEVVSLITLKGLKRARIQKEQVICNISENAVDFSPNLI
jgi:hypothetical protein